MSTDRSHPRRREPLRHIVVVGCGLIGGSILSRLARVRPRLRLTAVDRRSVLAGLRRRGWVDDTLGPGSLTSRLAGLGADAVVLATPVDAILELLPPLAVAAQNMLPARRPLIIDVASVKLPVVATAQACACPRFVGGHPMAGDERSGLAYARPTLFDGCAFALCPASSSARDRRQARNLVHRLGARPVLLAPEAHDRAVALVSHLPHLAAWSLVDAAAALQARLRRPGLPLGLAAGSWRGATRVAAADPVQWSAILGHNREAVLESLDLFLDALSRARTGLCRPQADPLAGGPTGLAAGRPRRVARLRRPAR